MAATVESIPDVEMTDVSNLQEKKDTAAIQEIRDQICLIEKAVQTKETRFMLRVLRTWSVTRRKLNPVVLWSVINDFYIHCASDKDLLLSYITMPTQLPEAIKMRSGKNATGVLLPEIDGYIRLLVLVQLIDNNDYKKAVEFSDLLMVKIIETNRFTLDLISAKAYFYHMRCYELTDQLHKIKGFLYSRLRTATLKKDYEGQAVLINCLLRNYLHYNLYDQADKLIQKSVFPEKASNNECARFLYYQGRIKAIRLEYSIAHKNLLQALRKAPENTAVGFRQIVQKFAITVELLLGDIPERYIFRQASLRKALVPYFRLTQSVRLGDMAMFSETLENFKENFLSDHTYMLVVRLRHNVIKTAIRAIGESYSRISFDHIAEKLGLDSSEDAEFIVSKAIRDDVIQATIDSEHGYVLSKEPADIYCTLEPQVAFHQRISFSLNLHNQIVKDMRYPHESYGKDLESAKERREREQQKMELAKKIAEEDDDAFL
ncbi:probable 26S proteasome non-ATPase regulatory subunit 3 [Rhopalosiphum maidis]|uniref:probable 26S proteasome non-ATPase regulatory subunit 3 n=1 Tax=Rhopalosiphum maidis TaxID=43146 RepID=UPI000EFEF85B|nr:probable 26S proteasome non-ATPase regulatory subunit 3 [Rhopalosiphum maidis]